MADSLVLVPALPHDLAVAHDDGADEGMVAGLAPPALGELERPLVVAHARAWARLLVGARRVLAAEDRRAGDEQRRAGGVCGADGLGVDPAVDLDEDVLGQRRTQASDPVDRFRHELLAAVAGMDAHAEDEIGVRRDGGDVLGLALGVEGDAGLQAVLRGRRRSSRARRRRPRSGR